MWLEKNPRAFTAGPRVGEPPASRSGGCPRGQDSEGGRELSLQDGSARPTAALPGRRQACGRRERQGAGVRLGVPDGGERRGWGRGIGARCGSKFEEEESLAGKQDAGFPRPPPSAAADAVSTPLAARRL